MNRSKLSIWTRIAHVTAGSICLGLAGVSMSCTYGLIGRDFAEGSAEMIAAGILGFE
jgi:hypothetical protein